MEELITAIPTGITAFTATNLDDLLILSLWFSQINNNFRIRHIIIGQFLGFSVLVIASLPGFFGGLVLPDHWIGLLGLAPIAIGLNSWLNQDSDESEEANDVLTQRESSPFSSFLSPQTYSVAAITVANGSDNISIYVPLFANSHLIRLVIILCIFFLLVGVWCYTSYKLISQKNIADILNRYGNNFVPFVLVGLGVFIILESEALHPLALLASCLCIMGIVKKYKPTAESEEN
ncbi:cadmium resistance transporter [Aetokthonos hydrillicola Thurmond2011]|jgi:cadmium resistance transport/sequestration family protein|uniref:Cadmium resistance transporter n=1 Tax=Aetokthonos hydrillicola Thurmond2011 TaxID=2712845 RepID=A0AAP5M5D4_9CYAN|nr:cadmium resistance transporter [Aetokthonos hydrillicola]MBO3460474.1 transporter [Aetokthonos hydrillicola CCALA 1050]MBW4588238.1 cadmium resistance transporter [Aetokthonos hydrillicola CCALA 1050]MDR9893075.1 cadmium resistance transporter [Aetokthonos hydrillicola Thurmond2011]